MTSGQYSFCLLLNADWLIQISEGLAVCKDTVASQFLEHPRETEIGARKQEVREIESKITEKLIQGKRKLVREIGRFEKSRVREIGLPLYITYCNNPACCVRRWSVRSDRDINFSPGHTAGV